MLAASRTFNIFRYLLLRGKISSQNAMSLYLKLIFDYGRSTCSIHFISPFIGIKELSFLLSSLLQRSWVRARPPYRKTKSNHVSKFTEMLYLFIWDNADIVPSPILSSLFTFVYCINCGISSKNSKTHPNVSEHSASSSHNWRNTNM